MVQMTRLKYVMIAVAFASFSFFQFVILRLANQAGRGFLENSQQELVYYFIQVFVILGFFAHALMYRILKESRIYGIISLAAAVLCFFGSELMLFWSEDSAVYLLVTGATVFLLGFIGGAAYLKTAFLIADGKKSGLSIGIGYAAAVAIQYVFQLRWTLKPMVSILLAAACAGLCLLFHTKKEEGSSEKPSVSRRGIVCTLIITFALLIFVSYFNSYIHHLQVASGYTGLNAYSWPRLLMIPGVILFGFISDIKGGKYLPISTLCMAVFALLNTVLAGKETYLLSMCLFYLALSAEVLYYIVVFMRLARSSKHPALVAPAGRVLDSTAVLLSFLFSFSTMPPALFLVIDIVSLGAVIVAMAVNGDFNFSPAAVEPDKKEFDIEALRELYGLTPTEFKVFRELVETEDKQNAIAAKLGISVNTLRHHITSIYRKTETQTRSGLNKLIK